MFQELNPEGEYWFYWRLYSAIEREMIEEALNAAWCRLVNATGEPRN